MLSLLVSSSPVILLLSLPPALLWIYKYFRSVINRGLLLRLCQLQLELTVQLLIMPQQQPDRFKSF